MRTTLTMRTALAIALALMGGPAMASELSVPIDMIEAMPRCRRRFCPRPRRDPRRAGLRPDAARATGSARDWPPSRWPNRGDGAMAALLARLHGEGLGVARDTATAMLWLERAAWAGDAAARHDLALLLLVGDGVKRDEPRALGLLRALAAEGYPEAAYDLAQALLAGERNAAEREEGGESASFRGRGRPAAGALRARPLHRGGGGRCGIR